MLRRITILFVTVVCVAACGGGGDNGESGKAANTIASDALSCLRNAKSMHISADINAGSGSGTSQHLTLNGDTTTTSVSGEVASNGTNFNIVSVNGQLYVNAPSSFWTQFASADTAATYAGKWVQLSKDLPGITEGLSAVTTFTNYRALADSLTKDVKSYTKGNTGNTPDDRPAVAVDVATTMSPCTARAPRRRSPWARISRAPERAARAGWLGLAAAVAIAPAPAPAAAQPAPTMSRRAWRRMGDMRSLLTDVAARRAPSGKTGG